METEAIIAASLLTAGATVLYMVQRVMERYAENLRLELEIEKARQLRDRVMSDNYYNCRKENEILHALLDQRSARDVQGR